MNLGKRLGITDDILKAATEVLEGKKISHPNQKEISTAAPPHDEITAADFKALKAKKKMHRVEGFDRNKKRYESPLFETYEEALAFYTKLRKTAPLTNLEIVELGESVEQIDELERSTMASYVDKADKDRIKRQRETPVAKRDAKFYSKNDSRLTGINRAVDKLNKEEVEQIDEISATTLKSYEKSAKRDVKSARDDISYQNRMYKDFGVKPDVRDSQNTIAKRTKGIELAKAKINLSGRSGMTRATIAARTEEYVEEAMKPYVSYTAARPGRSASATVMGADGKPHKTFSKDDHGHDYKEQAMGYFKAMAAKLNKEEVELVDEEKNVHPALAQKAGKMLKSADKRDYDDHEWNTLKKVASGKASGAHIAKASKLITQSSGPGLASSYNPRKIPGVSEAKELNTANANDARAHDCAKHVVHEQWGVGETVATMHAEPDAAGNIAWYDVMFEHGIEREVPTSDLEITLSETHVHKKSKRMSEEADSEIHGKKEKKTKGSKNPQIDLNPGTNRMSNEEVERIGEAKGRWIPDRPMKVHVAAMEKRDTADLKGMHDRWSSDHRDKKSDPSTSERLLAVHHVLKKRGENVPDLPQHRNLGMMSYVKEGIDLDEGRSAGVVGQLLNNPKAKEHFTKLTGKEASYYHITKNPDHAEAALKHARGGSSEGGAEESPHEDSSDTEANQHPINKLRGIKDRGRGTFMGHDLTRAHAAKLLAHHDSLRPAQKIDFIHNIGTHVKRVVGS